MSTSAPAIDIYLLNKGALFSSQPVNPPAKMIKGEIAVPKPNKTAKVKLLNGAENVAEYLKSKSAVDKSTKPRVIPNVKALTSNLP
jgi:hypothetical protein